MVYDRYNYNRLYKPAYGEHHPVLMGLCPGNFIKLKKMMGKSGDFFGYCRIRFISAPLIIQAFEDEVFLLDIIGHLQSTIRKNMGGHQHYPISVFAKTGNPTLPSHNGTNDDDKLGSAVPVIRGYIYIIHLVIRHSYFSHHQFQYGKSSTKIAPVPIAILT